MVLPSITSWKVRPRGAAIWHEECVAREYGIADDMYHASWCMAWRRNREARNSPYLIGIAVFKLRIELRTVTLEFCAFIEYFPESFLDIDDPSPYADFTTQRTLDVGCS